MDLGPMYHEIIPQWVQNNAKTDPKSITMESWEPPGCPWGALGGTLGPLAEPWASQGGTWEGPVGDRGDPGGCLGGYLGGTWGSLGVPGG